MFDPPLHTDFSGFIDDERADEICRQARIKWLQDKLAGVDLYSIVRRRWEDELWGLLERAS